jgi:acyl dehydratase
MTPSSSPPSSDPTATGEPGTAPPPGRQQRTLDRGAVADYAEATADTNPIHLDARAARAAGLPAAVAHGMLSVAVALEAARRHPGEALSLRDVRFLRPAPVGAEITVALQPDEDGWQFRIEASGERIVEGAIVRPEGPSDQC